MCRWFSLLRRQLNSDAALAKIASGVAAPRCEALFQIANAASPGSTASNRCSARPCQSFNRLSQRGFDQPAVFFLFLLAVTAVVYIPALLYFGGNRWWEFGPFSIQASRVLLYAAYFFIGAGIGAANFERGVLSARRLCRRRHTKEGPRIVDTMGSVPHHGPGTWEEVA